MNTDSKITIITCDDDEEFLNDHKGIIQAALGNKNIPFELHQFSDGSDALEFIRQRGAVDGIILITDARMNKMGGWGLFEELIRLNLVPNQCALCSDTTHATFKDFIDSEKFKSIKEKVKCILKDAIFWGFEEFLPEAVVNAGKEIGLTHKFRPNSAPRKRNRRASAEHG